MRALLVPLALLAFAAGTAGAQTAATCSARGMSAALPKQQLPPKVAATRARIARAAVKCGYAALERIARENPGGFTFTYGSREAEAGRHVSRVSNCRLPPGKWLFFVAGD